MSNGRLNGMDVLETSERSRMEARRKRGEVKKREEKSNLVPIPFKHFYFLISFLPFAFAHPQQTKAANATHE